MVNGPWSMACGSCSPVASWISFILRTISSRDIVETLLTNSSLRSIYNPAALPLLISAVTAAPYAPFSTAWFRKVSRLSKCFAKVKVVLAAARFLSSETLSITFCSLFIKYVPALPAFLCEYPAKRAASFKLVPFTTSCANRSCLGVSSSGFFLVIPRLHYYIASRFGVVAYPKLILALS